MTGGKEQQRLVPEEWPPDKLDASTQVKKKENEVQVFGSVERGGY